ncbi:MAG TPA: STM4014 family protein [Tepidisphaeraceae bacterium]|nr:STM4014 family protein [Tepidisphaeraceae bacterium]
MRSESFGTPAGVVPSGRLVVLGNPGSPRVKLVEAAAARQGLPAPTVVAWGDWIAGRASLAGVIRAGDLVRIESPGKDFEVERAILAAGAERADDDVRFARASAREVAALAFDKGRILWPRQWYLGFAALLARLGGELAAGAPHVAMNDAGDVAVMFDKPACHARLAGLGVPQPRGLGVVHSYDELIATMARAGAARVFVKLAHGSSASGVVAYQTNGRRHKAVTTVETAAGPDGARLYNTRRARTLTDAGEIARLIDALCAHRVHVERWLPKAGLLGRTFDLRVVVIGGRARHAVARLSRTPMTNLHLLNDRADADLVRRHVGEPAWAAAMASCERAVGRGFARSLYAGVDLMFTADLRRHAVIEANAFGDQIPGVLHDGAETYDAEIAHCLGGGVRAAEAIR